MPDQSFTFTLSGRAASMLTAILMGIEMAENQSPETVAAAMIVADELHPQMTAQVPQMVEELDEWLEKEGDNLSDEEKEAAQELRAGALQRYEELQMTQAAEEAGIDGSIAIHVPPEKMV